MEAGFIQTKQEGILLKKNGSAFYSSKTRAHFIEAKWEHVFARQNMSAFLCTILIGMHVGSLGIRFGRVGIAWMISILWIKSD